MVIVTTAKPGETSPTQEIKLSGPDITSFSELTVEDQHLPQTEAITDNGTTIAIGEESITENSVFTLRKITATATRKLSATIAGNVW